MTQLIPNRRELVEFDLTNQFYRKNEELGIAYAEDFLKLRSTKINRLRKYFLYLKRRKKYKTEVYVLLNEYKELLKKIDQMNIDEACEFVLFGKLFTKQ